MQSVARVGGVVVFVVSAFLLTSIGGAGIVASPVTLPLMYLSVRLHPTPAFRAAGVVIGGLTALEGGWGLGGLLLGDYNTRAWWVAVPCAVLMAVLFATVRVTDEATAATQ